ncbi:MAG: hypothetical protein AB8B72_06055 [Crocinitomicaceae bacterium]
MRSNLEIAIEKLDFENLNILQISSLLNSDSDLTQISNTMTKIRKRKQIFPPNVFGKCGIDRRANDCGDASEY